LSFITSFLAFFEGGSVGIFTKLQEMVLVYFARQACKSRRWELNVVVQIRYWLIIIVWDKYYWVKAPTCLSHRF
jgi:hypothetical protein